MEKKHNKNIKKKKRKKKKGMYIQYRVGLPHRSSCLILVSVIKLNYEQTVYLLQKKTNKSSR